MLPLLPNSIACRFQRPLKIWLYRQSSIHANSKTANLLPKSITCRFNYLQIHTTLHGAASGVSPCVDRKGGCKRSVPRAHSFAVPHWCPHPLMLKDQIRHRNTHGEGRVLGLRLSFLFYLSKCVISCTEQQLQAVRKMTFFTLDLWDRCHLWYVLIY